MNLHARQPEYISKFTTELKDSACLSSKPAKPYAVSEEQLGLYSSLTPPLGAYTPLPFVLRQYINTSKNVITQLEAIWFNDIYFTTRKSR